MGDLLFLLKMMVYTLFLVILLQVKIGPTTLEQKLYKVTHESQLAGTLISVAQGAATFVGVQYNKLTGHLHSKYIEQHSATQRPGERLQKKLQEIKKSMNGKWQQAEEETQQPTED